MKKFWNRKRKYDDDDEKQRGWYQSGARKFYYLAFFEIIVSIIAIAQTGSIDRTQIDFSSVEKILLSIWSWYELILPILGLLVFIRYRRDKDRWLLAFIFAILLTVSRFISLIIGIELLFTGESTDILLWNVSGTIGIMLSLLLLFLYLKSIFKFRYYQ